MINTKIEYVRFRKREDRINYLYENFSEYLVGRIIDVGCDKGYLRSKLKDNLYVGIDLFGASDIKTDLDNICFLPVRDNAFDTVICTDVLEHLDKLHHILDEMVRVCKCNIRV